MIIRNPNVGFYRPAGRRGCDPCLMAPGSSEYRNPIRNVFRLHSNQIGTVRIPHRCATGPPRDEAGIGFELIVPESFEVGPVAWVLSRL
jgi:hypothetical protein